MLYTKKSVLDNARTWISDSIWDADQNPLPPPQNCRRVKVLSRPATASWKFISRSRRVYQIVGCRVETSCESAHLRISKCSSWIREFHLGLRSHDVSLLTVRWGAVPKEGHCMGDRSHTPSKPRFGAEVHAIREDRRTWGRRQPSMDHVSRTNPRESRSIEKTRYSNSRNPCGFADLAKRRARSTSHAQNNLQKIDQKEESGGEGREGRVTGQRRTWALTGGGVG